MIVCCSSHPLDMFPSLELFVIFSWWGQTLTLFRKGSVPSFRTRGGCCWLCCHIVICTQSKGAEAFLHNSLRRSPNSAGRDPSFFWRAFTESTRIGQSACKDWSNWGCCLTSDSVHHLKQHLSHILSYWQKSTNWRWFGQGNQEGADFFRCDVAFAVLWNAPLYTFFDVGEWVERAHKRAVTLSKGLLWLQWLKNKSKFKFLETLGNDRILNSKLLFTTSPWQGACKMLLHII